MISRLIILLLIVGCGSKLNTNPDGIQVITSDIDRFWSTVDNYGICMVGIFMGIVSFNHVYIVSP